MSGKDSKSLESTYGAFNASSFHVNEGGDEYNSDATIEEENYFAGDSLDKTKKRLNDPLYSTDTPTKRVRVNTQWPDNVQEAFEEAICLIPKKTLKNIKINGTTQGRNQYISMYIQYKTGIYRTPKQVSSHIQGLCSSKREYPMKKFLIEGPDESDSMIEKFSQLFSKIMREHQLTLNIEATTVEKFEQRPLGSQFTSSVLFPQDNCVDFKKIDMCYVNFNVLKDSHVFSKANDSAYGQVSQESIELSQFLKKCPNFYHILNIFDTTLSSIKPEFPLITIDVPILLPFLESDLLSGNYNFSARFTVTGMPKNISYNVVTVVMKGGKNMETKINQLSYSANKSKTDHTFNIDIASNYWKSFFSRKHQYQKIGEISDVEFDVNCTTVFHYILDSSFPIDQNFHIGLLKYSTIKCLLVWNFKVSTDELKIRKIKEFLNSKSPQKSLIIGNSVDKTFKLSTPLSIIAEQRRNGIKPLTFVKPSVLTDSPLSGKQLNQGFQSLITPPHTAFPCTGLNETEPHNVLFNNDQKQTEIIDDFIHQDIFNNITQQKIFDNDVVTDKENYCNDDEVLEQNLEDYKNIFSSPNLQMYEFL